MTAFDLSPIDIERASEQLRQERETFDQHKKHEDNWFVLRLTMGYAAVLMLAAVLVISSWIIFHPESFSSTLVKFAGAAFFVDTIGLVGSIWKAVLKPNPTHHLAPVTKAKLPTSRGS